MKKIFFTILSLYYFSAFAQVQVNTFSPKENLYLQTLKDLATYLKSKPTKHFSLHSTSTYTNDEAFYDTVISMFFNKEKMLKNFEKNTEVFAVEGKVDIIRHILNNYDYYVDIVPIDSFFVRAIHHTLNVSNEKDDFPELEIFIKTEGKEIIILSCGFDNETNKLLGFSIIGTSDPDEPNRLMRFLKRQQTYHYIH